MNEKIKITKQPKLKFWYPYLLKALHNLDGKAKKQEAEEGILKFFDINEEVREEKTQKGHFCLLVRINFARVELTFAEYIDISERGVWALTDKAKKDMPNILKALKVLEENYTEEFISEVLKDEFISNFISSTAKLASEESERRKKKRQQREQQAASEEDASPDKEEEEEYLGIDGELSFIKNEISSDQFEQVGVEILKKLGYKDVIKTQSSRDGGYDGEGYYIQGVILHFKVIFESKQWKDNVGVNEIKKFYSTVEDKKAAKGIFITTSDFSTGAEEFAERSGKIMLINGERLIELLREYEVGYEKKPIINKEFFKNLKF